MGSPSARRWSWLPDVTGWFRTGVAAVLQAGGPVPRHVAIVMDGNRRFAQSRNLRREAGHTFGADKLLEVLEWCLVLGVRCLSVYAFSTDNFKRSQPEIDVLFALAEEKLDHLATSPVIAKHCVRVQVLGELRLLPPGLQRAAGHAMAATWHHDGPVLNVCFAYTGREDIAQAVGALGAGVAARHLAGDAVTEETLQRCLYGGAFDAMVGGAGEEGDRAAADADPTSVLEGGGEGGVGRGGHTRSMGKRRKSGGGGARGDGGGVGGEGACTPARAHTHAAAEGSLPVDLLIRTSGETRLSDFILWGASQHAVLCFLEVLWPDFSFTDMCYSVWQYQRSAEHSLNSRARYAESRERAREREKAATGGGWQQQQSQRSQRSQRSRRGGAGAGAGAALLRDNNGGWRSGGEGGVDENGGTTVAWVNLEGGDGVGDGGAGAFLANHNRRKVAETLRMAAIAKT
jgi:undecaprenyl diphosphate synthase